MPDLFCARCNEAQAVHTHHRKLRSQGGDNSPANLARLCLACHDWCHHNPAAAYAEGWLVHSWDDPAEVRVARKYVGFQQTVDGEEVPHEHVVGEVDKVHNHGEVKPGEKCPTCHRRVNHPKKKDSPNTKVFGYRVPIDDVETHEELAEAAARELDEKFTERPHWKWALNTYAYGLILQGARLEETGA